MTTTVWQESTARFTLEQLTSLFAACFEGYLVPMVQPVDALAVRFRSEQIDLHLSRVIHAGGAPAGLCLLAQRGRRLRVAGMGIVADQRGLGLGRALLESAVAIGRTTGADRLTLEVISANRAALGLYESCGFRPQRNLLGHERAALPASAADEHELADSEALAAALAAEPDRPWPWQLAPHTVVAASASLEVHALGKDAYAWVNPAVPGRLGLRLLYVRPQARRQGRARRLLASIQARYPEASWEIPAVVPEDFSPAALAALGFRQIALHQLEMERSIDG